MNVLFMAGPGELEEPVRLPFLGERTNLDNFTTHSSVHPHSSTLHLPQWLLLGGKPLLGSQCELLLPQLLSYLHGHEVWIPLP